MPGKASHEIRGSRLFEDRYAAERPQEKFRAFIKLTPELARK
jgi:hypothetical protein